MFGWTETYEQANTVARLLQKRISQIERWFKHEYCSEEEADARVIVSLCKKGRVTALIKPWERYNTARMSSIPFDTVRLGALQLQERLNVQV